MPADSGHYQNNFKIINNNNNNNKHNNDNLAVDIPLAGWSCLLFPAQIGILNVAFVERGKLEDQRKALEARTTENQQQNQTSCDDAGPGIQSRPQWWEVSTLATILSCFRKKNEVRLQQKSWFSAPTQSGGMVCGVNHH